MMALQMCKSSLKHDDARPKTLINQPFLTGKRDCNRKIHSFTPFAREYLTGFHKRKVAKRKEIAAKRERQALEERKERRREVSGFNILFTYYSIARSELVSKRPWMKLSL